MAVQGRVGGAARAVGSLYARVGGVSRAISAGYVRVGGVSRQVYQKSQLLYEGNNTTSPWVLYSWNGSAWQSVQTSRYSPEQAQGFNGNVEALAQQTAGYLRVYTNHSTVGYNGCAIRSASMYNFTEYSVFYLTFEGTGNRIGASPIVSLSTSAGLITGNPLYWAIGSPAITLGVTNAQVTHSFNVAGISGNYYIYIQWQVAADSAGPKSENYHFYKMWMS